MKHTVEEVVLKNGARGLLIHVPDATVMSFQFHFRAGNRFVKSKKIYETAHLMEHMSFGANAKYKDAQEYEAEFTKNGAYHNAYTSDYSMCYIADCADFEWDRIMGLQQVAICQPKFNETEMKAEKGNVRSELTGYLNNHNRILWPRVQQELGEDVYTYTQRLETLEHITLDDVCEHHRRTHTTRNMRFVIAGKIGERREQIMSALESWQLPEGERFTPPRDTLHSAAPVMIHRKESSNLTFGASIYIPRVLSDEEDDAMGCLNHLLTGTMHSRIYGAARKQGLAYGVFSDINLSHFDTSWDFGGQVNLETVEKLFEIIVSELLNIKSNGVNKTELEAAKSYALGRHQMGAQTVAQISGYYAGRYFSDDFVRDYDAAPDEIRGITQECIQKTASEFMQRDAVWMLAGVSAGEQATIQSLHDAFSKVFSREG